MDGSSLLRIALLGLAIFVFDAQTRVNAQPGSKASSVKKKPNIIFILADDQGWNGTSVQMHPEMPNSKSDYYRTPRIEKLASEGMRFSHAYSPGPMCSPTRASLQTGKSPAQLRMTNVGRGGPSRPTQRLILPPYSSSLAEDEVTIGETLKNAGYATAWFGKWHLGGDGPGAHGYDQSDGPTGNADGNTNDPQNPKDIFGITQRGIAFMEKNVKAGKPFYLQLWHYAVHGPVQSKQATEQRYAAKPAGQTHNATDFAAMTEDLDTGVGLIMDKVEQLSIADNTYIIYMSDHGAGRNLSSNAPLNRGKGTLWEGGLRVPLIVCGPGVRSGAFCNVPTVGWDMFPTFCELAGVDKPLPNGLEGASLKPLFATGSGSVDRAGKEVAFHFPHYSQGSPHSTITIDGFKLIRLYDPDESYLFDLDSDIGEQNDLAKANPDKTRMLRQRLDDYLANINAAMPSSNPNFDPTAVAQAGGPTDRRGGRGGRSQISERIKELAVLEEAIKQGNAEKIGQLISDMKKSMENTPPRSRRPRPGTTAGPSPREMIQKGLQQIEEAHQSSDTTKLRELIVELKTTMDSIPARPSRRGPGQRGPVPTEPDATEAGRSAPSPR